MAKLYKTLLIFLSIGSYFPLIGQEIRIFTQKDFDLIGKVKSCLVSTNYGKEEYDFDLEGRLVKSLTRYNGQDYDITYYKYQNNELVEKRSENYRDNVFDRGISIANFYETDTTAPARRVIEKIVSYDKEYLDQYEYIYDSDGLLKSIMRTNNEGIDETMIEYASLKGENTKTLTLNGMLLESVRTSERKIGNGTIQKIMLSKKYLYGEPNTAMEEKYDGNEKLVSRTHFKFDPVSKQFTPTESATFTYNTDGVLIKSTTKKGATVLNQDYVYQFDNGEKGNWIKQIITPGNAYITRRITYYEPWQN